jgi:signal transduction histidine kinase
VTDQTGSILVEPISAGNELLNQEVEVLGVFGSRGSNAFLSCVSYRDVAAKLLSARMPILVSAQQVLQLSRAEAARGYPVRLNGVITCVWPENHRNAVLQDATRGIFMWQPADKVLGNPQFGEFWEVEGVTGAGEFSPMVNIRSMRRLGDGRLPEPVRPEWDELVNGSLDNQFVEIEGVVIHAEKHSLTLLAHWGKIKINVFGDKPPALEQYENKLVRLRGCLQALWDAKNHLVKIGEVRIGNVSINADQSFSADPFAAPAKRVQELRLFDMQASAFRRVKISGQFLQRRGAEYFMTSDGSGLRFVPNEEIALHPGDLIDVAGVPDLRGASPMLREAVARKTGTETLPIPKKVGEENLLRADNDAARLVVEGVLLNVQRSRDEQILELRSGLRSFVARLPLEADAVKRLDPGSRLRLTGVYAGQSAGRNDGVAFDSFDLLLNSTLDIQVLSRPPWWTFKRLLLTLGILAGVLGLAGVWIVLLRRQVDRRTAQLERVTQQREQAERARAVEEERLRIARDLHDTMEQALAGISFQLGALAGTPSDNAEESLTILGRARLMVRHAQAEARRTVRNLRMFALERNNLAGALEQLAKENPNLAGTKIAVSVGGPAVILPIKIENHLLRIGQEAITNALKHAHAQTIRIELIYDVAEVQLKVTDDGRGFEVASTAPTEAGDFGLLGMRERADKLGGVLQITSQAGVGTTVLVKVPLSADAAK